MKIKIFEKLQNVSASYVYFDEKQSCSNIISR